MSMQTQNFTTGPCTLPDVGTLTYNGCVFSPLFTTTVSGKVVKDAALRTTKFMEYSLAADGYVTCPTNSTSISPTMVNLRKLLTAQGGFLRYEGRGMDLTVNPPGGAGLRDVAWGPVPELLEFQPLGGGMSAKVKWQCVVRVPEVAASGPFPLLQFNYDTSVTYSEDGFSTLSMKGTLEIPLTRPTQASRVPTLTADDMRARLDELVLNGIDLTRFRVVRRNFPVSRDKRTLEFDVAVEELPYMNMPANCTIARGTYTVRPAKAGMGLVMWLCTLRATYTVRNDKPRRVAWLAFLALLRLRMSQSTNQPAQLGGANNNTTNRGSGAGILTLPLIIGAVGINSLQLNQQQLKQLNTTVASSRKAWLIDFSFDEGLYLDSKTTSFSATWRLVCPMTHILLASGLWEKVAEGKAGQDYWSVSMNDVSRSTSWLANPLRPDIIIDFGGGS